MIRRPPRSSLSPCTTLFRSLVSPVDTVEHADRDHRAAPAARRRVIPPPPLHAESLTGGREHDLRLRPAAPLGHDRDQDRKSTRLNSSHANISYAVFCLKKKH